MFSIFLSYENTMREGCCDKTRITQLGAHAHHIIVTISPAGTRTIDRKHAHGITLQGN